MEDSCLTSEIHHLRHLMNVTTLTHCKPQAQHPVILIFLSILSVTGLVFNGFSLWIFWFKIKNWNSSILLQFNLALTDAISFPTTPLMVTYISLGNRWPFGQFLCQLHVFALGTHLYGSTYFLMLISIHRYHAIVHYNAKTLWRKRSFMKKLILAVWLLLFIQSFPVFFFLKTSVIDNSVKCLSIYQSEMSNFYLTYGILLVTLCFLLPFSISMASYVMLGRFVANLSQANLRGRVMKTKSRQMIIIALVIFVICFTPLHVCMIMAAIVVYYRVSCELLHHIEVAYCLSAILTMVNSSLDPFIYNFANERFHKIISKLLRK